MTIAMFSLIIFSLVMIATMNQNFTALFTGDEADAGWDVRADSLSANPIADFTGTLQAEGVDTSDFTATGVVTSPSEFPHRCGLPAPRSGRSWRAAGMNQAFIEESELTFGSAQPAMRPTRRSCRRS